MDFEKKSHLSARSKRRRVQEELQSDDGAFLMGDLNNSPTTSKNRESSFQTNINICSSQPVSLQLNETIDKSPSSQNPQEIENLDLIYEFLNNKSSILTSSESESEQDEDNYINETR